LNNPLIKNLNFTFSQISQRVTKLTITDSDNARYSIPTAALPNPGENTGMRLD
jgi:hypothetical protein